MGIVEEVGAEVTHIGPGDRVVVPFNISCGRCFMCKRHLYSQCETTQNSRYRKGASLFGYTHLYGGVPGGQADYLRVPMAHFGPVKVPEGPPDNRFLLLSDVLPTSWQAVEYADASPGDTIAVWGLGPIGQMCGRIARHRGARVIGVDSVPERLEMARRHGIETVDLANAGGGVDAVLDMTDGRGADSAIDAVGMEAHGSLTDRVLQTTKLQADRFKGLHACMSAIRRGGTLSISGVYVGAFPLWPIGALFDKQISIRQGQANVRCWVDDIMPLLIDPQEDPLGVDDFVTHDAMFREKRDGAIKVVLRP
jgi:threonine dehydrogenase-like Zn-dependent dehydrogenase